jgi:rhodanese-related sulfurtransferase
VNFEEILAFATRSPFNQILSLALVALTVAIVYTEIARLFRGYKALRPAELTHLVNSENALVVDLSASNELPSSFGPEHKLLAGAKSQPVVLVCRTGQTAGGAAKRLKKAGFEKVYVLDGGVAAWQQADLPLVKGR